MSDHRNTPPQLVFLALIFGVLMAFLITAGVDYLSAERYVTLTGEINRNEGRAAAAIPGWETEPTPTQVITTTYRLYTPLLFHTEAIQPQLEVLEAWTSDALETQKDVFQQEEEMGYWARGSNNFSIPTDVHLTWTQSGPCGGSLIYSDTITIDPGLWEYGFLSTAPSCSGVFTPTAQVDYQTITSTLDTQFSIQPGSYVIISEDQGFDRCYPPEVSEMANWWENSPYLVYNVYIGGVNYYCRDYIVDADWVRQVADQGWDFILTWMGLQAPCSNYYNRISYNQETAYNQGHDEALAATEAAFELGFDGESVIYYDMEGYPEDNACRAAVDSFMRGWVEELHTQGLLAGGYGAGCTSKVSDWADNDPPPDDVWIAHWYRGFYDSEASVWDATCVDNALWNDHQRIKQYAGDHTETWGGLALTIDSDVLDGQITALTTSPPTETIQAEGIVLHQLTKSVQDVGLLEDDQGWVLSEGKLWISDNDSQDWRDISPSGQRVQTAVFLDRQQVWTAGHEVASGEWLISRTVNGGRTWTVNALPLSPMDSIGVAEAFLDPLDASRAWVALRLVGGSSASAGRLFYTGDGGESWVERELPLGEAVAFLDSQQGWVAGGPGGDQLYRTQDGGRSWSEVLLDAPSDSRITIGLPSFSDKMRGALLVGVRGESGSWLRLYRTEDGGENWLVVGSVPVEAEVASRQWSAEAWSGSQIMDNNSSQSLSIFQRLPQGTAAFSQIDDQRGWIVVQSGNCQGVKQRGWGANMRCEQRWQVLETDNEGNEWRNIFLPSVQ